MLKVSSRKLAGLALTLGLAYAGAASAIITVTDHNGDGSFGSKFHPDDITYGDGSGEAFVTPLLFTTDLGDTKTAKTQVGGAGMNYSYLVTGGGTSPLKLQYTFTSTRLTTDTFPNVTGLRFMLDVIAFGSSAFVTTDVATQKWPPVPVAGDPDKRQIQDLNVGALNTLLVSNNGVTDNANNCALTGCTTDFGLEWDRATLTPGQSWTINVTLVDNPALVSGGRYLRADSVDVPGNVLFVGNPTLVPEPSSYAMLLAGVAMLAMIGRRRLRKLG
jgi:hypothetical protein